MLEALKSAVLAACVVASFASVVLFCIGAMLRSKAVRDGVTTVWVHATDQLEQATRPSFFALTRAMLAALFEDSSGKFSGRKFWILMFVLNVGALLGMFLSLDREIANIASMEKAGALSREDAVLEHEKAIEATIGLFLLAPLALFSWALFDYVAYRAVNAGIRRGTKTSSFRPVFVAVLGVLSLGYLAPLALSFTKWGQEQPLLLYLAGSPLVPAMYAFGSLPKCWTCAVLTLPAGLSATLTSLLLVAGALVVNSRRVLRLASLACERVSAANGRSLQALALNLGTAAGVLIVVLTWRSLFPDIPPPK